MKRLLCTIITAVIVIIAASNSFANTHTEHLIPFLGVTMEKEPVAGVAHVVLIFEKRNDACGLAVHFLTKPGKFSKMAETAIDEAIRRAAKALNVSPDSWTVVLRVPYPTTVYGDSISAMIGISAVIVANGKPVYPDRVMTGTITPDGRIGTVSAVPLKVLGAAKDGMTRILVPDETDVLDPDWKTPFLTHVSPIGTVQEAYRALTEKGGAR